MRRRAIAAAAVGVLCLFLTGALSSPQVVLAGVQNVDAPGGARRVVVEQAAIRVVGTAWRPVGLTFTLAPAPGVAGTTVRLDVPGVAPRELRLTGPEPVVVDLPRLRGVGANDRVQVTNLDPGSPVDIREAGARVRPDWALFLTIGFALALGAWLVTFVRGAGLSSARTAAPGFAALAMLAAVVAALRKPDALLLPQLWAEDGAVFLKAALAHGLASVFEPYAGYHHLFPRLVAAVAAHLPRTVIPLAFNVAAFVPLVVVARLLASPRLALTPLQRVACLLLAVVPPMPGEVLLNLTNTPWIFGLVLVLMLLAEPARGAAAVAVESLLILVSVLTGPLCLALAPLFAWRAAIDSTAGPLRQAGLVVSGAVVQGLTLARTERFASGEPLAVDLLLSRLGQRMLDLTPWTPDEATGFLLATGVLAMVVAGLVVLVIRRERHAAFCLGAAVIVSVVVLFGIRNLPGALAVPGGRYFSTPMALILWSAVLVGPGLARPAAWVAAVVLVLAAPAFAVPPLPDLHWREASACLDAPHRQPCSISINPAGWSVDVGAGADSAPRPGAGGGTPR